METWPPGPPDRGAPVAPLSLCSTQDWQSPDPGRGPSKDRARPAGWSLPDPSRTLSPGGDSTRWRVCLHSLPTTPGVRPQPRDPPGATQLTGPQRRPGPVVLGETCAAAVEDTVLQGLGRQRGPPQVRMPYLGQQPEDEEESGVHRDRGGSGAGVHPRPEGASPG